MTHTPPVTLPFALWCRLCDSLSCSTDSPTKQVVIKAEYLAHIESSGMTMLKALKAIAELDDGMGEPFVKIAKDAIRKATNTNKGE